MKRPLVVQGQKMGRLQFIHLKSGHFLLKQMAFRRNKRLLKMLATNDRKKDIFKCS
jgi:hypothetical protein